METTRMKLDTEMDDGKKNKENKLKILKMPECKANLDHTIMPPTFRPYNNATNIWALQ